MIYHLCKRLLVKNYGGMVAHNPLPQKNMFFEGGGWASEQSKLGKLPKICRGVKTKKGGRGQSILIRTGGDLSIEKIRSYRVQN